MLFLQDVPQTIGNTVIGLGRKKEAAVWGCDWFTGVSSNCSKLKDRRLIQSKSLGHCSSDFSTAYSSDEIVLHGLRQKSSFLQPFSSEGVHSSIDLASESPSHAQTLPFLSPSRLKCGVEIMSVHESCYIFPFLPANWPAPSQEFLICSWASSQGHWVRSLNTLRSLEGKQRSLLTNIYLVSLQHSIPGWLYHILTY